MKLILRERSILDDIDDKIDHTQGLVGIALNVAEWDRFCKEMRALGRMSKEGTPLEWKHRGILLRLEDPTFIPTAP